MATVVIGANMAPLVAALQQTAGLMRTFAGALGFGGLIEGFEDVGAAIATMRQYMVEAVDSAAQFEQSMAVFSNTFKINEDVIGGSSAALAAYAEQISKTSTISVEAALKMTQAFTRMGNITADRIEKAMKVAADTAATFGKAPAQMADMMAKALENPASLGPLRRLRIVEPAKLQAVTRAAGEGTPEGLQRAQDLLIAAFAEKSKGGAEAMTRTWAGAMQQVRNELDNISRHFGEALLPVLKELLPVIRGLVEGFGVAMGYIGPFVADMGEMILRFAETIGIVELLVAAFDFLAEALKLLITVATLGSATFDETSKDMQTFENVLTGIGLILSSIAALVVRSFTWMLQTVTDLFSDWSFTASNKAFEDLLDLPKDIADDLDKSMAGAENRKAEREKRRRDKENQITGPEAQGKEPTKLPAGIPLKGSVQGAMESLTGLYTRISEAAGKEKAEELAQETADNTASTAQNTGTMVAKLDTLINNMTPQGAMANA